MNRFIGFSLVFLMGCGLSAKMKRLSPTEQDHFHALSVYMNDDQKKAFLKEKTEEERNQWLKDEALWERFYKYEESLRKQILMGDVQVGFTEDQVYMAWGEPAKRLRLTGRPATRSEMLVYRFEVDRRGNTLVWTPDSKETYNAIDFFEKHLFVDDRVVTEIQELDEWE